jgi:radical SAM-linked protein
MTAARAATDASEAKMRIIARFEKGEEARFLSHLDVQRMFQRAFRRAGIPVAYSEGYNPHPLISFATALALGYTSESEWLDTKLERDMQAGEFTQKINSELPPGFRILKAFPAAENVPSLTTLMHAAEYQIRLEEFEGSPESITSALNELLSDNIFVNKRSKSGFKIVDIKPMVYDIHTVSMNNEETVLSVTGCLNASGSLNIDLLLESLFNICKKPGTVRVHRKTIFSYDGNILPKYGG